MKAKHTPEPWAVGDDINIDCGVCTADKEFGVAETQLRYVDLDIADANARRIVACVNACNGINPAAVPMLMAIVKNLYLGRLTPSEAEAVIEAIELAEEKCD